MGGLNKVVGDSNLSASEEPPQLYHIQFRYCLQGTLVVHTRRNPRHTNWPEYCDLLKQDLDGLVGKMAPLVSARSYILEGTC